VADKPNRADDTEANEANKAKADKANRVIVTNVANKANFAKEANVIDEAVAANEANKASLAKANKSLANCGIAVVVKYSSKLLCHNTIIICVNALSQFSLTKYSVFIAEVKGYFGINNNQLGGPFGGNEIDNQLKAV
jgi:hypothetical protein